MLYLLSGAMSELASLCFRRWTKSDDYSVGASGAISGVLAAIGQLHPRLARQMFGFAEVQSTLAVFAQAAQLKP